MPLPPDLVRLVRVGLVARGVFLRRVEGEQHGDVLVLRQVVFPSVPLAGGGVEHVGEIFRGRMVVRLHRQRLARRVPCVARIVAAGEKFVLIPAPISLALLLAVHHRKGAGVEADPRAAALHEPLERLLLRPLVRAVVEEDDHVVPRQRIVVQKAEIGAGEIVGEAVFLALRGEPLVRLPREIGVRGVATLGETERKRLKAVATVGARLARMRAALLRVAFLADAPMLPFAALPIAPNVRMRIASRKSECARNRQSDAKRREREQAGLFGMDLLGVGLLFHVLPTPFLSCKHYITSDPPAQ